MKRVGKILTAALCLGLILLGGCRKQSGIDPRKPDEEAVAALKSVWEEKSYELPLGIYAAKTLPLSLTLDQAAYDYYRSLPRYLIYANYVCYMKDPYNEAIVNQLVEKLLSLWEERNLDSHERLRELTAFIQNLDYVHDIDSRGELEWPKYPIETLYDGGGDCEDLSILLASALQKLGYRICFLLFADHVGVGIEDDGQMSGIYYEYEGIRYFFIETTAKGWDIGGVPEEYKGLSAKMILVKE